MVMSLLARIWPHRTTTTPIPLHVQVDELRAVETDAALLAFDRQNHMGASDRLASSLQAAIREEAEAVMADKRVVSGAVNIKENADKIKEMRAFWLPSKTPEAQARLEKPDGKTLCPASGKALRLKDLITLKLTHAPGGEAHEYMDPVTRQTFTNALVLVCLKPTGDVMLQHTYNKYVKPDGAYDGVPIGERDVIELQRGGTGFAAHDKNAQVEKYWALGPGSGLADLRGQHQGTRSAFGLSFNN